MHSVTYAAAPVRAVDYSAWLGVAAAAHSDGSLHLAVCPSADEGECMDPLDLLCSEPQIVS